MSFSPALAHRQRVLASIASGAALAASTLPEIDDANPAAAEYRQLLASLHNDLRALHDIESIDGKIARKALMITSYLPWVQGALTAGETGQALQDEIVATVFVWSLDLRNWELALALGDHMLRHGVSLPERYKRSVQTLLVDRISDTAKEAPEAVSLDVARAAFVLTQSRDMPDQARAKLHRAIGLALAKDAETFDPTAENAVAGGKAALVDAALGTLKEALRLDKNVGVKKQIEVLEREARKLAEAAGAAASESKE